MLLDDLHKLIETLQARITEHGAALSASEALTRYALIDPLLRELGWDTSDPAQVQPEYPLTKGGGNLGFVDYALMRDGEPRIIVEAKKLGTGLQSAVGDGVNKGIRLGIPYVAATDGQHWELYDTFKPVALTEKLVIRLDVLGPVSRTCLDALALWQAHNLVAEPLSGAGPVIEDTHGDEEPNESEDGIDDTTHLDEDWLKVSDLTPTKGDKPLELRLPNGVKIETTMWVVLLQEIVRHIQTGGHLQDSDLPVRKENSSRILLNTKNEGANGKPFNYKRQIGNWYFDTNFNAPDHMDNIRRLLEVANLDAAEFAVRIQKEP